MALVSTSPLYGLGNGLFGGLGQQQAAQNTFTATSNTTNAIYWGGQSGVLGGLRQAAIGSPAERVQASLPKTLRAELQEEVDAWLPKLATI